MRGPVPRLPFPVSVLRLRFLLPENSPVETQSLLGDDIFVMRPPFHPLPEAGQQGLKNRIGGKDRRDKDDTGDHGNVEFPLVRHEILLRSSATIIQLSQMDWKRVLFSTWRHLGSR